MGSFQQFLLVGSALLLLSVITSKASGRFGIPALLLFLGIGMLPNVFGSQPAIFADPFARNWELGGPGCAGTWKNSAVGCA